LSNSYYNISDEFFFKNIKKLFIRRNKNSIRKIFLTNLKFLNNY
jgi:hypothetical protein